MGNRPIFAGAPTIEVDLDEWEKMRRNEGRMDAACDYIRHVIDNNGYFGKDDAHIVLKLLGCNYINLSEKKINETEKEEETE